MQKYMLAYFVVLLIHLAAQLYEVTWFIAFTKPLLVPLLMGRVWQTSRSVSVHVYVVAALFFSWVGDILLLPAREDFFVFGLAAFLLAHGCYIREFSRGATFEPIRLLPFIGYPVLLLSGPLHGNIPADLRVAVYLYIAVLTGMGCMATLRRSASPGYERVLVGAVLFILSDSFLALNKFSSPLPLVGFWVMLTYALAQFFIVDGYLLDRQSEK
jgi:uncharacterized membrane protein YhhN